MSKGRKAIPAVLKDNNTYHDQAEIDRQIDNTPTGVSAKLACPADLTSGAKKEWRRIVKLLAQLDVQVLCDLDTEIMRDYCIEVDICHRLYERWIKTENCEIEVDSYANSVSQKRATQGNSTTTTTSQRKVINPTLKEYNRHVQTKRVLAEQLGLTPIGRAAQAARTAKEQRSSAEDFMGDD